MSISKNAIAIGLSALFLIASIAYSLTMKNSYTRSVQEAKVQGLEIESVASLQKLWGAKGEIKKINTILQSVSNDKKVGIDVKRSKASFNFVNLTDRELNKILTKLAMQPVQFKKLKINRSGENYSLECLCVW